MAVGQYLYGPPRPVMAKFLSSSTTAFGVGELVLQIGDTISLMGTGTTVTNFLGVTAQKREGGSTVGQNARLQGNNKDYHIRVDTDGVWAFTRSDTIALSVGDPMTTDGTTANTLAKAGDASISIGRVAEPLGSNANGENPVVKVRIMSRKFPPGEAVTA